MPNALLVNSLRVGFETMRANPLRTILSTLGIVIGVGALVSVLSIGDGMERLARDQIGSTTDLQRIAISPRFVRTVDGTQIPVADPPDFTATDAADLRAVLGDSVSINLMLAGAAMVHTTADTTPIAVAVTGMLRPDARLADSMLIGGRLFTLDEAEHGAPVALVTHALAATLAHGRSEQSVIGDTVYFQGQPRTVIGILRSGDDDRAKHAFMPFAASTTATIAAERGRPTTLLVTAASIERVAPARAAAEQWAARRFGQRWKDRVSIASDDARLAQVQRGLLLFKLFMGALMSISLVVGGIGIMNVLLSSVIERTREIGIRKAAGAAQRDILWQFLGESVAITGVGSVVGLVIGVAAAFGVTAVMRRIGNAPVYAWLSPSTVIIALAASVLVGLTFGLYPALRAARLSPIDAIHHE